MIPSILQSLFAGRGSAFPVRLTFGITAVWLLAALAAGLLRRSSAAFRHRIWILSIVAALLLPAVVAVVPERRVGAIHLPTPPVAMVAIAPAPVPVVSDNSESLKLLAGTITPETRVAKRQAEIPQLSSAPPLPPSVSPRQTPVRAAGSVTPTLPLATPAPVRAPVDWTGWCIAFWLVVALSLLLRHLLLSAAARRLVRHAGQLDDSQLLACFGGLLARIHVRGRPRLLQCDAVDTPFCVGWLRPAIVLPPAWRQWPAGQLNAVLTHELAHVARRDVFWQLLARLSCCIYWFHPFTWLAAWRVRVERELACDDWVLREGAPSTHYARWLLNVAATMSSHSLLSGNYPFRRPESLGVAMAARSGFEERIVAILDPRRKRFAVSRRMSAVLVLIAAGLIGATGTFSPMAPLRARADVAVTRAGDPARIDNALDIIRTPGVLPSSSRWLAAMDDLIAIGRPAVPALTEELAKTDDDFEQSVIALTLHAIGDRRAAPALIYALARCKPFVHNIGLDIEDPEQYLLLSQLQGITRTLGDHQSLFLRPPPAEIIRALVELTGHDDNYLLNYYGYGPSSLVTDPSDSRWQLDRVYSDRWLGWWEANKGKLLDDDEMKWVIANAPAHYVKNLEASGRTLALTVSTPSGVAGVAEADIEVWAGRDRYLAQSDFDGKATLPLRTKASQTVIRVRKAGYVPIFVAWSHDEIVPRSCVVRMTEGATIGGIVEDAAGKPVSGVSVFALATHKLADHTWADVTEIEAKTDAEGKWSILHMPATRNAIRIRVDHPNYSSDETNALFAFDGSEAQTAFHSILLPASPVEGRVTGADGKAVSGAIIHAKDRGNLTCSDVKTDAEGRFKLRHVRSGQLAIAVQAEGFAPALLPDGKTQDDLKNMTDALDLLDLELEISRVRYGDELSYYLNARKEAQIQYNSKRNGLMAFREAMANGTSVELLAAKAADGRRQVITGQVSQFEAQVRELAIRLGENNDLTQRTERRLNAKRKELEDLDAVIFDTVQREFEGQYQAAIASADGRLKESELKIITLQMESASVSSKVQRVQQELLKLQLAQKQRDRLEIKLTPGENFRGRVIDPAGKPVAGAAVVLHSWQAQRLIDWSARTREDGTFNWPHAPPNLMELDVIKSGYQSTRAEVIGVAFDAKVITLKPTR